MKIAVLLSGGVDSSVALRLLMDRGHHELTAFYLKVWLEEELAGLGDCPWQEDLEFAQQICTQAKIPLEVVPFQREYRDRVVEYALEELKAGGTPSSDLLCNQQIKFGAFLDHVGSGFDRVASGHYARREAVGTRWRLARSPDPVKDQTYFLALLSQEQLARCEFPLGALTKAQVRALAKDYDLPTRSRPDSQGICFLGKIPFDGFIRHHLGEKPGEIREARTGRKLGEHRGYWFHTIGQRRGLGLSGGPWYVIEKVVEENLLLVAHLDHMESALRTRFRVERLHWIDGPPETVALGVKLRHGPNLVPCRLELRGEGRGEVTLETGDPGIAPGQFAVFYSEEYCLGSGVIR